MSRTQYYCQILMEFGFFCDRFSKYAEKSNLIKIRPVRAELFYVDRRTATDRHDEATGLFSQFCELIWNYFFGKHSEYCKMLCHIRTGTVLSLIL